MLLIMLVLKDFKVCLHRVLKQNILLQNAEFMVPKIVKSHRHCLSCVNFWAKIYFSNKIFSEFTKSYCFKTRVRENRLAGFFCVTSKVYIFVDM